MKYYIGHIHEYGKDTDKIYVEELSLYNKVINEEIDKNLVESRISELKAKYPDSNILHFIY